MLCPQQEKTSATKIISYYVRNPEIAERKIDEASFLIDPETDIILYLNPLSSGIWQLLKKPVSVLEAIAIVQQAFPEIPSQKIAGDVSKLINKMCATGFLSIVNLQIAPIDKPAPIRKPPIISLLSHMINRMRRKMMMRWMRMISRPSTK